MLLILAFYGLSNLLANNTLDGTARANDDYLDFELIKLNESLVNIIDSIVSENQDCNENGFFWYIDFEKKGDTIIFTLSLDNIGRLTNFMRIKKVDRSKRKATIVNDQVVLIVDSHDLLADRTGCQINISNPSELDSDEIAFIRFPSWVFVTISERHFFVYKNNISCN